MRFIVGFTSFVMPVNASFAIFCCRAASTGFYERSKTKNLSSPKTNALDFCFSVAVNWPIGSAKSNAIVKVDFLLVNDPWSGISFYFVRYRQIENDSSTFIMYLSMTDLRA
jgi:hypothetical protein